MIEFNVKKTKLQLDFSFFAVLAFCFFLDQNSVLLMSFFACIIHETGHLIAMLIYNINIKSLCFYGAGIKLGSNITFSGFRKTMIVLLAGSFINLMTCVILFLFGRYTFAAVNLVIGLFNLLAIGDLDGKQLLLTVAERYQLSSVWLKILSFISYSLVLSVSLLCGDYIGITFYITLIYMLFIR